MCGIFGYIGNQKKAGNVVLDGLKALEYRGYDSWGVAVSNKSQKRIVIKKRVGKIGKANVKDMPDANVAIGHTRWATHGGVLQKNAHPHGNEDKSIAIVHNGIIENFDLLKRKLKKKHTFISDTDSEVSVYLIEDYLKTNSFSESVRKTFLDLDGLNALIALSSNKDTIVGIRNGSPLVVGFGKDANYIASDASALIVHTNKVYYLEDDEMVIISKDSIRLFDAKSGKKKKIRKTIIKDKVKTIQKGSYKYFMLKEIFEQPSIIKGILTQDLSGVRKLAQMIKHSYGTYFVGCGTAAFACMAGSYIFSKVAKRHINWAVASEFGFQLEFLTKRSFVVAVTQSGETMDTIQAMKKAREKRAKIGGLVNVEGSTLFRFADVVLGLNAGVEKGVASTKAFIAMVSYIILTAYEISGDVKSGQRALSKAQSSINKILAKSSISKIKKLARKIQHNKHIYIVGRGLSYPTSLESALKIKEISYIHAEGFAAGELKHGVIALIEKGTPCIVFAPQDETYAENIAGAMELKARGGYIVGISETKHEIFDYHISVKQAGVATILPNVVFAQLLAYYLTLEKGYDPDMPRNLAKSVTVK